jgi:uncharacterized protein (TIRG00374 family)
MGTQVGRRISAEPRSRPSPTNGSEAHDALCIDCLGRDRDPDVPVSLSEIESDAGSGLVRMLKRHRRPLLTLLAMAVVVAFVYAVLPQVAGFGRTLHRLRYGNKSWLAVGVACESVSLLGYMALFRLVFSCGGIRIGWRASYQITMAGAVATKVFAAGGAGGVALTLWALRAAGLKTRALARRMTSFEILLYTVFMGSLVVFGLGLFTGLFAGRAPLSVTALPAAFGAAVIALALAMKAVPGDIERRLTGLARRSRRARGLLARLATIPRTLQEGITTALEIVRHPRPGLLGALVYWAFDIATLWAGFRAFGASPPIAVVVMAYFLGQLANAIPLPGGIGGVEGGMIGSFIAFGVSGSVAVLAVLAYRLISFWLPILPGSVAYFQLRRTVARWKGSDRSAPGPARSDANAKPRSPQAASTPT